VPLISGSAVHPLRRLLPYGARDRRLTELLHLAQLDDKASIAACELSHDEKQWLEIAMLLASDAELLLLDEPTAGMTIAETERTADLIKNICFETGKTILAIEHDMHSSGVWIVTWS
jgi:urea transport system ATP-binding protein